MSDFADKITADPSQREHLLQVVEFHRTVFSNGDLVLMSPNIKLHIMKLY